MRRVIVLRPEPGATETVRRASERGLDAISLPLFEIEPISWSSPDPDSFDALLLTSANAVRWGGIGLCAFRQLPVHAVGETTAQAAVEAGFEVASTGESGVDELLASLDPNLRLLHLCGEDRRVPAIQHSSIVAISVYRSKQLPSRTELGQAEGSVVLVHSPRSGQRFAQIVDELGLDRERICIAAISPAAEEAVGRGWAASEAAERPNDDALLALALRLCNNSPGR